MLSFAFFFPHKNCVILVQALPRVTSTSWAERWYSHVNPAVCAVLSCAHKCLTHISLSPVACYNVTVRSLLVQTITFELHFSEHCVNNVPCLHWTVQWCSEKWAQGAWCEQAPRRGDLKNASPCLQQTNNITWRVVCLELKACFLKWTLALPAHFSSLHSYTPFFLTMIHVAGHFLPQSPSSLMLSPSPGRWSG